MIDCALDDELVPPVPIFTDGCGQFFAGVGAHCDPHCGEMGSRRAAVAPADVDAVPNEGTNAPGDRPRWPVRAPATEGPAGPAEGAPTATTSAGPVINILTVFYF